MAETPISQETSDVTIFPLAVLALHLLLLLSAVGSKMSLHSVPFFFFVKHLKCLTAQFLSLISCKLVTPVLRGNIYHTFTTVK